MAPTRLASPHVCARLVRLLCLALLVFITAPLARAQSSAVYHLHKDGSGETAGWFQLKTAGPDAASFAFQSLTNLKNAAAGEHPLRSFDTLAGEPNRAGTIPAGAAITFSLYMRKTGSSGVIYPRAKLYRVDASDALTLLGTVTGATALTTTVTKYTLTVNTSSAVTFTPTDRFHVWVGLNITTSPNQNNYGELSVEGTLNGNHDSQVTVPLPNTAPTVSLTSPANNASFNAPANITINASASDTDGTISKVEFFQGATKLGEDTSNPFSFTWSSPPAASFPYTLTAAATDNQGATATSSPVSVYVAGSGTTSVVFASPPTPASVNLTTEGTADWAHWGRFASDAFNHKAGVTQQISNFTRLNAAGNNWLNDNPTTFTWTDGSPTGGADATPTGVWIGGVVGGGFEFTVPAGTVEKTLKVYVGLWCAQGKLEAFLSDGSAVAYADSSLSSNTGTKNGVYTINFKAASAGQTLTVRYTILNIFNPPNGNITLEAATLTGGPPVLDGVSPATATAGTTVTLSGSNFGNTQGTGTVTFNGTAATPTAWTNTSVTVAVPAGATSGPVVVTARGLVSGGVAFNVAPQISGVSPASGVAGASVTISGTSFGATQGTSAVTFNGLAAAPTSWGDSTVVVPVPANASTGPVVVTVGGTASNGVAFTVISEGTLGGAVTRTSDGGPLEGATIEALQSGVVKREATTAADGTYTMSGLPSGTYDLRAASVGAQTATRSGVVLAAGTTKTENFTLADIGSLTGKVTQPDGLTAVAGATVKLYRSAALVTTLTTNAAGDYSAADLAGGHYTVEAAATGFVARSQPALVTGNTNTVVNVSLEVLNAGPITYAYDELGRLVSVSTPTETATYKYDPVGNLLSIGRQSSSVVTITEFTPNGGAAGTPVTIHGAGFGATAAENSVSFNGTAATVTSANANQITTSVPAGATTGAITVTAPGGTATSATSFNVSGAGAPTINGFTPAAGPVGTSVTVTGTNFETVRTNNRVKVNLNGAVVESATAGSLVARVSNATASGRVSISTPGGSATSADDFFVTPYPYNAAHVGTTGRMTVGESRAVSLPTADKIGLFVFDGTAGQSISLWTSSSTIAGGQVTIYRPDGVYLNSTSFSTSTNFIDATVLPLTGTYTIMVDPSNANTGGLTLNLRNVVHVTGSIIAGGAGVPTTVHTPGQNVTLTFNGTAGQRVSLGVSGNTYGYVSWDALDVRVKDPSGAQLGSAGMNTTTSTAFVDTMTLPVNGTYTVTLDPPLMRTGSATFTLYDVVDITDTITVGSTVTKSNTVPGQNVRLAFAGTAGQKVSVVMTHSGPNMAGTPSYSILRPDGSRLAGIGNSFIDATTIPANGTYTLLADPSMGDTGSMTMTTYNVVDVTGQIPLDGTPDGIAINTPGQNMAMTFQGTAGQKVTMTVTDNWFGFLWYWNTYLQLKKPDGTVIGQLDVNAGNYPLFLDATVLPDDGTYTVWLDPSGTRQGGFNLRMNLVSDVTGTITADGTQVTKTIGQAGQNVLLTFEGAAGQVVNLSTSITGFSSWPRQYILKPDGTPLVGPANATLGPVTLPAAGTYTVKSDPVDMQTGTLTFTLTTAP